MEENVSEGNVSNFDGGNTSADAKHSRDMKSSPNDRADSPDSNCAICLGKLQNKSFTDSCLHQFCFSCLVEWSKVKPECPLCKQGFKSIIHNVRSIEDYDQYDILRPVEQPTVSIRNFAQLLVGSNRPSFRFRTTMVPVFGLLQRVDSFIPPVYSSSHSRHHSHHHHHHHSGHSSHSHRGGSAIDRRYIYNQGLWVRRLPDITGRYRKCSPRFLAQNPAQVHRLVPWLHREINALLGSGRSCDAAISEIINMVVQYPIRSVEFRNGVETFLGSRTDHFIHEFHSFAISPYDTIGYDRNASYGPGPVASRYDDEEQDSSSSDSDVQIVDEVRQDAVDVSSTSDSRTASPEAGPSGFVATVQTVPASPASCIDITSDPESDMDECVVVGTVKPRHLRTPEVITISDDELEGNDANDENLNIDHVYSEEEDIKPTPDEIAHIKVESCKPSTSKLHSRENNNKHTRFRRIYNKYSSNSESDSSNGSKVSSEEEWNKVKTKKTRAKSKPSKKKSKESDKREAVSKSKKRTLRKRSKKPSSVSGSSDDESDCGRKLAKRRRVLSNSSCSSSHSHSLSHSSRCSRVEASATSVTPPRLRSVVYVRRNTQDSSHNSGDGASCSGTSSSSRSSKSGSAQHSRLLDGVSRERAVGLELSGNGRWTQSSSNSASSSSTSSTFSGDEWHQRKYKYRRKHN